MFSDIEFQLSKTNEFQIRYKNFGKSTATKNTDVKKMLTNFQRKRNVRNVKHKTEKKFTYFNI